MVTSLGRRLYNLTARSATPQHAIAARPARPDLAAKTALIWLHAPTAAVAPGLMALAQRLIDEDGAAVVLTCPEPLAPTAKAPFAKGPVHQPPPADTDAETLAFLDHWQPRLIVIADGEVRPALLQIAAKRGVPVLMADARAPNLPRGRDGWFPGLLRESLAGLAYVMALDEPSARGFRKAGAASVEITGRLAEQSAALPCLETERAALATLMATRPIWLAACVAPEEEAAVIAAHRATLRLAHRLLLIMVPQDPSRAAPLAAQMEAGEGWMVAQRGLEQEPDPDVEVYIPDNAAEYGLWYRLAPTTFLGGSLAGSVMARNPMEPAALGSAILHGPRPGAYGPALGRLGAARAARAVASAQDLAEALADLLSPDRSARYAQAAWTVTSEGAATTEAALARIRSLLADQS